MVNRKKKSATRIWAKKYFWSTKSVDSFWNIENSSNLPQNRSKKLTYIRGVRSFVRELAEGILKDF